MDSLIEYKIPFKGIREGQHEYEFHVEDTFFVAMESEDIHHGDINVKLKLDKQSRMMILDFEIQGNLVLVCDRCLEDLDFPLDINYQLIVKYREKDEGKGDGDILYLGDQEYQLDVSTIILENILLALPIKNIHPEDSDGISTCNPDQIALIEDYAKQKTTDPRWDVLKSIKFED